MPRTALQWLSLVGAIWLQSINGTNSNFPAYSSQLKQLLSLSQLQLNNLAFASDAGKLFGWFSGIAAVYLPLWIVLLIGSSVGMIGYGVQYLFLTHKISSLSYGHIFFLTVLAGNSICWINTVCYIVIVRNFPLQRQAAVGLTTGYIGLSPVVYTAIVDAFYSQSSKTAEGYLLLNSILPLIVSVITAPFMSRIDVGKPKIQEAGFIVVSMITVATGIYAIISSLGYLPSKSSKVINVIGIGLCLSSPLVIPLAEYMRGILEQKCTIIRDRRVCDLTGEDDEEADRVVAENEGKDVEIITDIPEVAVMEDIGAKLMLKRLNFWLYFFVYFLGATLGLVYLNNLGQIAESRSHSNVCSLVSFSSAFGFFGRLFPVFQHYFYSRSKKRIPGPASIVCMMVPMAGGFFLLVNGADLSLYFSTAIIGACTGAITSISVSVTTELFGTNNFGVNHNIVVANIPMGSFVFGNLAALLYRKARKVHERCIGLDCYKNTFIIWGTLCSVGIILALILHLRTRKFYFHRL
ncbi:hypothetical protein Nepgr_014633 [Nepenthes gracilis]|uniref:Nodulin-like domain-containing protein n=1 Tax=Nepenthes gracilis TaxID=150966 RepID=A0AAD3XPN7_NEPGR|nr:hypothetical protein Nepgr_014633 [Nepenthes gracilis]